jgi:hypothetical protein
MNYRNDGKTKKKKYWITLRKRENTGNREGRHYIALCEEVVLEQTMELSLCRLREG